MKKRVLTAIVVFAIMTFLCACNSTKPDPSMKDNDTTSNSSFGKADTSVISEETDEQKEDAIIETKAPFVDLEDNYSLRIPIYVITHWSIKYDFSKSGDNYYFDDFQFDENGRLISYAQAENDTSKKWNKYTLEYDENNNIVKVYYDAARSSYSTIAEFEYDENNNCIRQTTTKKEDPSDIRINTYSYDERDFQIGRTAETNEVSSSEEFSYEIDDQGRVTKQSQIDGVKKEENGFEYDESGRLIKETETNFDEDGNTKSIYESEFEYDSYGHILHVKTNQTYDEQGDLSTGDRTFDYTVGGFFTIQAQDTDTLKSPHKWLDVIEQPIHCNVQKTEEGVLTLDLFIRSETGHFSEPDLGMTLYADGRETEIRNKGRIGGDASMTLAVFLKAAAKLRKAITEQGLVEEYRNADPEKEGLLVAKNEDQFSFKLVSGRKRPSMTCTTLLNGIQMGRPYKDETMEAWKRELMPEEGLEELAESGDEAAMNDLANAYLNGDGVEQNFEKSLYWWKKLAECNDPTGQYNVGLYYAKGCGVERDFEKATEWMRKSSENGDKDAEKLIDLFAKAGENLQKAESGDADAQAEVANLMMYLGRSVTVPGIDSEDEFKEAVKWAQKAADNGSGEGCWILGLAYEHGRGVKEDLNLAIEYFEKGVNLGHAKCMGNLGAIYMNGQVKGKTKEDGFRLMRKAAELGDVHSMKNVGSCYQFGNGVEDSMRKAIYWYEKYLEHEEDAELERKVRIFKTLPVLMEEEGEEDKTGKEEEENERNRLIKSFITILRKESIRRSSEEARQEKESASRFRVGIFVNGVPKEGKRVVVNNDFSVFIPYGCYYRTMVLGTDNVVLKIGRQESIPEEYTDGAFKLYGDEEDANWFIDVSILRSLVIENAVENGIPDLDIQEWLDEIIGKTKETLGVSRYNEAINNRNGLWNRGVDEVNKMLIRNVLTVASGLEEKDVTRVKTQSEVTAVFGIAGEEKSEPSWRSYIVLVASRKALLVGMVYFNCAFVEKSFTDEAMKTWLEKFEADENTDIVADTSPVFDWRLKFDLPEGYEIERGTDDDGKPTFRILHDVTIDEEGGKKAEYYFDVERKKLDKDTVVESNIDSNFKAVVKDTISLAFRLAMLEHLYPEGEGLAVFDDAFTEMDPRRVQQSCELIRKFAEKNQVIFITCDDKYSDLMKPDNIIKMSK